MLLANKALRCISNSRLDTPSPHRQLPCRLADFTLTPVVTVEQDYKIG
jgi:hypothetical protein